MDIVQFLQQVWSLAVAALTLDGVALQAFLALSNAGWVALALAVLAGFSKLLGDSIALFINRVTPKRFVLTLVVSGVLFALELVLWAVSIRLVANLLFGGTQTLAVTILVVAAASAPWLFGFLVFMPYLGGPVRWVLRIWSWLIVVVVLRAAFDFSTVEAFLSATVGWLALRAVGSLFARRLEPTRDWFWTRLTGTPAELTFEQQAEALARQLREGSAGGGT